MRLQELAHQVWMLVHELFAYYHVGGYKFPVRPERTLVKEKLSFSFDQQARSPGFSHPCSIYTPFLEQGQDIGGIRWHHLYNAPLFRPGPTTLRGGGPP